MNKDTSCCDGSRKDKILLKREDKLRMQIRKHTNNCILSCGEIEELEVKYDTFAVHKNIKRFIGRKGQGYLLIDKNE